MYSTVNSGEYWVARMWLFFLRMFYNALVIKDYFLKLIDTHIPYLLSIYYIQNCARFQEAELSKGVITLKKLVIRGNNTRKTVEVINARQNINDKWVKCDYNDSKKKISLDWEEEEWWKWEKSFMKEREFEMGSIVMERKQLALKIKRGATVKTSKTHNTSLVRM